MVAPHVSEVRTPQADPQITVTGHVKKNGRGTEMVVFKLRFLLIEITCIVPIPYEDAETVGVHLKFAVVANGK